MSTEKDTKKYKLTEDELLEAKYYEQNLDDELFKEAEEKKSKVKKKTKVKSKVSALLSDSVQMYLTEIGRIPTLNAEEELILTRTIFEEEGRTADKAQRALVQANLRLVVSVAKKYANNSSQLLDLIQEGNLGLMSAASKFDYRYGYRFSTFATWWIRQSINRSLADKSRNIRIPVHMIENSSKLRKVISRLSSELDRTPTEEELALAMDISLEKLQDIQNLQLKTVSMSTKIGSDDGMTVADTIESQGTFDAPDDYATAKLLKEELRNVINDLSEDEQKVMLLRYGLIENENQKMYNYTELADLLEMPKDKIKKLEAKALRKLKSRALDSKNLQGYI